jgi:phosphohistidine phosphatase SixA
VTLFLVRHASALTRSSWSSDDVERPLDERGRRQAESLTTYFDEHAVREVWSSRAVRCVTTVTGVAQDHGLEALIRDELAEGARPDHLLESMRSETTADGDLVMCSHGDLIPEVLNLLLREGMSVTGPRGCEKGSIWELETRGRDIIRGTYVAAP